MKTITSLIVAHGKMKGEFKMNDKLTLKEFLIILGISILTTPIVYNIVFAPMGWWMQ